MDCCFGVMRVCGECCDTQPPSRRRRLVAALSWCNSEAMWGFAVMEEEEEGAVNCVARRCGRYVERCGSPLLSTPAACYAC